jgi:hypothetical protein
VGAGRRAGGPRRLPPLPARRPARPRGVQLHARAPLRHHRGGAPGGALARDAQQTPRSTAAAVSATSASCRRGLPARGTA